MNAHTMLQVAGWCLLGGMALALELATAPAYAQFKGYAQESDLNNAGSSKPPPSRNVRRQEYYQSPHGMQANESFKGYAQEQQNRQQPTTLPTQQGIPRQPNTNDYIRLPQGVTMPESQGPHNRIPLPPNVRVPGQGRHQNIPKWQNRNPNARGIYDFPNPPGYQQQRNVDRKRTDWAREQNRQQHKQAQQRTQQAQRQYDLNRQRARSDAFQNKPGFARGSIMDGTYPADPFQRQGRTSVRGEILHQ